MEKNSLNLNEVAYLLIHKPLVIVRLQHSPNNKRLISKALQQIWQTTDGDAAVAVLQEFLERVTPKYKLDRNQRGVRDFLLREIKTCKSKPAKKSGRLLGGVLQFS